VDVGRGRKGGERIGARGSRRKGRKKGGKRGRLERRGGLLYWLLGRCTPMQGKRKLSTIER